VSAASFARPVAAALWLLAFFAGGGTAPAEVSTSGLSEAQVRDLRDLGFAVAPEPLPPGFSITSVVVDKKARHYTITYERAKDKATLTFEGAAAGGKPRKKSIFDRLGDVVEHKDPSPVSSAQADVATVQRQPGSEDTTPAIEAAEHSDVVSDSALAGPIHFDNGGTCLTGSPDASKAEITDAHFTVRACNLRYPEALIRAYKSLVRVQ
jgi:hypothetical protein